MAAPRRRFSVLATLCSLSCLGALPAVADASTSTLVNGATTQQSTDVGHTPNDSSFDAQSPDSSTDASVTHVQTAPSAQEQMFQQMEPQAAPPTPLPVLQTSLPSTNVPSAPAGQVTPYQKIGDPSCRAFFVANPPNVVILPPSFRPLVGGTVEFPDCTGSPKAKFLTSRTGKVCVQILEGSGRRRAFRSLKCEQRTFPTRSFGSYTISAIANCRRGAHRYRMTDRLTIQRGTLVDTATGKTLGKYIRC